MAVTTTSRLGITRWSSGGDPFTRAQTDADAAALESKVAIYLQGTAGARPVAGTVGRYYYATDTTVFSYDDGTAWRSISDPLMVTTTASQTLTNKTLTAPIIATIVNTGTLTLPTSTDTLVGRATTDTLTNKTLTLPTIGGTGATFSGSSSGTTVLKATAVAGTTTLTLPAVTDTLVGLAATQTLTGKTMSGASNTFTNIPESAVTNLTANYLTLTGSQTTTNKTLTAPVINAATVTGTVTFTSGTLTGGTVNPTTLQKGGVNVPTISEAVTLTNKTLTLPIIQGTGAQFQGSTSGTTTLLATAIAGTTTLTLPAATDTLVGRATTDTLTNKTLSSPTLSGTMTATGATISGGTVNATTLQQGGIGVDTISGANTLTNKTLTAPVIATIVNTGTLTLPTSTDTLVGRATTDTLTNKTINSASNTMTIAQSAVTGLSTALGLLAPISSPTFTGAVTTAATTQTGNGVSTGDVSIEHGGARTGDGATYIDFHSTSGTDYEARLSRASGVNGVLSLANTGTSDLEIRQIGAGRLAFFTTNSERMSISATGVVTLPAATNIGSVTNTEIGYLSGVTSAIQTQISAKSPTASPTFTGVPAAPTAAADTNTTQLATTAFVIGQAYAKLAGPTFTGTVTLPSTTSIGTISSTELGYLDGVTSGIQSQLDAKATAITTVNAQTASYTLVLGDANKRVEMNVATGNNLTVPLNSSVPYPIGTVIDILATGAGQTTVVATGGVTVNGTPGLKLRAQWSSATLVKRATDTWVLIGDTVA